MDRHEAFAALLEEIIERQDVTPASMHRVAFLHGLNQMIEICDDLVSRLHEEEDSISWVGQHYDQMFRVFTRMQNHVEFAVQESHGDEVRSRWARLVLQFQPCRHEAFGAQLGAIYAAANMARSLMNELVSPVLYATLALDLGGKT